MTTVDEARAALLHLLGDATSSTAVEDLEAAVRAESAETLAALREALIDAVTKWDRYIEAHAGCGTSEASTPQHNFTRKYAATPAER